MAERPVFVLGCDVDGTLHDTYEFILSAFESALKIHGFPIPDRSVMGKNLGMTVEACYDLYAPGGNRTELIRLHRQYQDEHLRLLKPFPDTIAVLKEIKTIPNVRIAAITSRGRDSALQNLEHTKIGALMDRVVTKEDVLDPKPHPAGIQSVLVYYSGDPKRAIMVGDSEADIMAGKNAGVTTVGFANYDPSEALLASKPDYMINTLSELLPIIREMA